MQPVPPIHTGGWSAQPKTWLHVNFAGPIRSKMLVVVVVTLTKWLEVWVMVSIMDEAAVGQFRQMFATFDLLEISLIQDTF